MMKLDVAADLDELRSNIMEVVSDYKADVSDMVASFLADVDLKPILASHIFVESVASAYKALETGIRACFPPMFCKPAPDVEENQQETKADEAPEGPKQASGGIKRPRLPKFATLPEAEKEKVLKAMLEFASQTRNMPLGEIKNYMPDELKRVYPYSTVYHHFTRALLQKLEASGVRTPASMADFPFSQIKALAHSQDSSIGNACIKAFMDIYGIKFAPEKTTLF